MSNHINDITMNPSGFVLLSDLVPQIIKNINCYSKYKFIGDRIGGYEEPVAPPTKEETRAFKDIGKEVAVQGYRLKVFDAYGPACAVRQFFLRSIENRNIRMKPFFYRIHILNFPCHRNALRGSL